MTETPRAKPQDKPHVSWIVVVIGGAMALEGIFITILSLPLFMFGGLGLIGITAGASVAWSGLVLAGHVRGNAKLAALVTVIGGGAAILAVLI